jgi:hypothetical protein
MIDEEIPNKLGKRYAARLRLGQQAGFNLLGYFNGDGHNAVPEFPDELNSRVSLGGC